MRRKGMIKFPYIKPQKRSARKITKRAIMIKEIMIADRTLQVLNLVPHCCACDRR